MLNLKKAAQIEGATENVLYIQTRFTALKK